MPNDADQGAARILIVDDEELIRWSLGEFLKREGFDYDEAANGQAALRKLETEDYDLIITDLVMPGMNGLEMVRRSRRLRPYTEAILLTGLGTRADAVQAVKDGLFDFFDKPITDYEDFMASANRAIEHGRLRRERSRLLEDLRRQNTRLEISMKQLRETYRQLSRKERTLAHELNQAQTLQQSLLPHRFPSADPLVFFAYYRPCEMVGGDFFHVVPLGPGKLAVYIADVAGHGLGAAMVTVIIRELIHAHRNLHPESTLLEQPDQALAYLNEGLVEENFDPPWLVTMTYLFMDFENAHLHCACAGHPQPLLSTGENATRPLCVSGPALGLQDRVEFEMEEIDLAPGDFLLLYSDGLTELRNLQGEDLEQAGVQRIMDALHGKSPREIGETIERGLYRHKNGAPAADDLTYLVVSRRPDSVPPGERNWQSQVRILSVPQPDTLDTPTHGEVLETLTDQGHVFRLRGKCGWQHGQSLVQRLGQLVDTEHKPVAIDLAECLALDSTMLGLILQYSKRCALHRPSRTVLKQFAEIGIDEMLEYRDGDPAPDAADWMPLATRGQERDPQLILSAHEALMDASDENRERFSKAVEMLRRQYERRK